MVSWWVRDSYLTDEQTQVSDAEIINASFGSSGPFRSGVRSKRIGHKTYTGRRTKFSSEPTPRHESVHKPELIFSY